ncbi:MAG: hypothetical protein AAGJ82_12345, partial [Bacteroidota bacterium]
MIRFSSFWVLPCLLFCGVCSAQTVLGDAQQLSAQLAILSADTARTGQQDTAKARVLATLSYYASEPGKVHKEVIPFAELLGSYANNPSLSAYLDQLAGCDQGLAQIFLYEMGRNRTREHPLQLLRSETVTSPANYLSIQKTVQDYQQPPLNDLQALSSSANNETPPPPPSILNQQAIVEGLFLFLTERAGEEVMVTFLQRLLDKDIGTFKELFPTVINAYSNYRFTYSSSFLANLRDAFYVDLQLLDLRLVELFGNPTYFADLQRDPVLQNIMSVYLLYSLVQNDVSVVDAMPTLHSYLYQRYLANDKERNLLLAETATDSPEYADVQTAAEQVIADIAAIYQALSAVESTLLTRYEQCTVAAAGRGEMLTIIPANDYFADPRFSLRTLLGADESTRQDLLFLPSLLRGRLAENLQQGFATVADYDRFYANPPEPGVWQAAGLAMARRLCGEWYQQASIDQLVADWRASLLTYDAQLLTGEQHFGLVDAFAQDQAQTEENIARLSKAISATQTYWGEALTQTDQEALALLKKLLSSYPEEEADLLLAFTPEEQAAAEVSLLRAKKERLAAIEARWQALYDRVAASGAVPALATSFDPVRAYLQAREEPLGKAAGRIENLQGHLNELDAALRALDQQFAPSLRQQQFDAEPMLRITDLLANWMYSLQSDNDSTTFVSPAYFGQLLEGPLGQDATLGLISQQLNHSGLGNGFSGEGLRLFTQATLQEFATIPERDTPLRDSLGGYYLAAFGTNTIRRILDMPLLQVPGNLQLTESFTDRYPKLEYVNTTAQQALDLVFNLKTNNHRRALNSFVHLLQDVTELAYGLDDDDSRPAELLEFMRKYGPFVA